MNRGSISLICQNLKNALSLLDELKTEVIQKNTTLDMEMDKLQNILTPTQRAKVRPSLRHSPHTLVAISALTYSLSL